MKEIEIEINIPLINYVFSDLVQRFYQHKVQYKNFVIRNLYKDLGRRLRI